MFARPPVNGVVQQHVEDASVLWSSREWLLRAPAANLVNINRCDGRVGAHLDALNISGDAGWALCESALDPAVGGAIFAAANRAIEERRTDRLERLFLLAQAEPGALRGLFSAFGWSERRQLHGLVAPLLAAAEPFPKLLGIACSAMHRLDPGLIQARLLEHPDAAVRARALRTAGELGHAALVSTLAAAAADADPACKFWAAWSAVLLGDRELALDELTTEAFAEGPHRSRAFQLALQAASVDRAHSLLQGRAGDAGQVRTLIHGAGLVGDPRYIPWLIARMTDDKLARLAGESFSTITGLDLARLDLERKPPENLETGPNDDPQDDNVDMDADEGLPWPDQGRSQAWWSVNGPRFASGTRYFMGAPVTRGHCIEVLKHGYQRQRIAAAHHLCLSHPGTQLFEWRAPAWRQSQELARLA